MLIVVYNHIGDDQEYVNASYNNEIFFLHIALIRTQNLFFIRITNNYWFFEGPFTNSYKSLISVVFVNKGFQNKFKKKYHNGKKTIEVQLLTFRTDRTFV